MVSTFWLVSGLTKAIIIMRKSSGESRTIVESAHLFNTYKPETADPAVTNVVPGFPVPTPATGLSAAVDRSNRKPRFPAHPLVQWLQQPMRPSRASRRGSAAVSASGDSEIAKTEN